MISRKKIKNLCRKYGKKISEKAIKKLIMFLEKDNEELIQKAVRNASFSGRTIIREKDF